MDYPAPDLRISRVVIFLLLGLLGVGLPLSANQSPSAEAVTPPTSSGSSYPYVLTFSDPDGYADLGIVNILINDFIDGRNACYLAYSQPTGVLYLVGDDGGSLTSKPLTGVGSLSNSQCSIDLSASSASGEGNTLVLRLWITFAAGFGGDRIFFLAARDQLEATSGWQPSGIVRVPKASAITPAVEAIQPGDGRGAAYPVSVTYRDSSDSRQLSPSQILVNSALDGRNACYLGYDQINNNLYLVSDSGGGLIGGVTPGAGGAPGQGRMENSQCVVLGAGTTVVHSGSGYTLTADLAFKAGFEGRKIIYAATQTTRGENSGWQAIGSWTVTAQSAPTAPPLTTYPAHGEADVRLNSRVIVKIPEGFDAGSVNASTLQLLRAGAATPNDLVVSADGRWASIRPKQLLLPGSEYTVRLSGGAEPLTSNLRTGAKNDRRSFYVTADLAGATDYSKTFVPPNAKIYFAFSPPMDPTTLDVQAFQITSTTTGEGLPGAVTILNPSTLVVEPAERMAVGTLYGITTGSTLQSLYGQEGSSYSNRFRAGFVDDYAPPQVLSSTPFDGAFGANLYSGIVIEMNEPVTGLSSGATVKVLRNGVQQDFRAQIQEGSRLVIGPASHLDHLLPSSIYTVRVEELRDLAGNVIEDPIQLSFQTRPLEGVGPKVTRFQPNEAGAALLPTITADFDQALAPNSFRQSDIELIGPEGPVATTALLTAGNRRIQVQPQTELSPGAEYVVRLPASIASVDGVPMSYPEVWVFHTIGGPNDPETPVVLSESPPDGAVGVPTQALIQLKMSRPPDESTVHAGNMRIAPLGLAAHKIETLSVSATNDGALVNIHIEGDLVPDQMYEVEIQGIRDPRGVPLPDHSWRFSTGGTTGGAQPVVVSMAPPAGSTGVDLQPTITLQFSRAMRPTTASTVTFVAASNSGGGIESYSSLNASGTVLTLSPKQPLQPMTHYVLDLSGLGSLEGLSVSAPAPNAYGFQTGAGDVDSTPPRLLSISPPDGATDVPNDTPVVLTFSEPINPDTVTQDTVGVFFDASSPHWSLTRSSDNRTFTIRSFSSGGIPSRTATIFLTSGIQDLAGNGLGSQLKFSYQTRGDSSGGSYVEPTVLEVRPRDASSRAGQSQPVTFFFNKQIQTEDLDSRFLLAADGLPADATLETNAAGDRVTLRPTQQYLFGSLVQGFALPEIRDTQGNELFNGIQGAAFRVRELDSQTVPEILAVSLRCCTVEAPVNAPFAALVSEPLAAGTVSAANVMASTTSGAALPVNVLLTDGGNRIEVQPQSGAWPASTAVYVTFTQGVTDLQGSPLADAGTFEFRTGAGASDATPPQVVSTSLLPGAAIPINAHLEIRFSTTVDATTVLEPNIQLLKDGEPAPLLELGLRSSDRVVSIIPAESLADNADYQLRIQGVRDLSGGAVPLYTANFVSGSAVHLRAPELTDIVPGPRAINSPLSIGFSEPISPVTVHADHVRVEKRGSGQIIPIAGQIQQSADGRFLRFIADQPLPVNSEVYIVYEGLRGLAGNAPQGSQIGGSVGFSTSGATDVTPPTLTKLFPLDGVTGMPLNTVVRFALSEKVEQLWMMEGHAELMDSSGARVPATIEQVPYQELELVLRPSVLLEPNETYTFRLAGITDLAGNVMPPVQASFTTGPGPALGQFVMSFFPPNHAGGLPRDVLPYLIHSAPIDPATVTSQTVVLRREDGTGSPVPVALELSQANMKLTVRPLSPLPPARYRIELNGALDARGFPVMVPGNQWVFTVTDQLSDNVPPTVTDMTPQAGATGAPVNPRILAYLSEQVNPATLVSTQQMMVSAAGSAVTLEAALVTFHPLPAIEIRPLVQLLPQQTYTVTLRGVEDWSGNPMAPFSWSFTTGASGAPDTTPPKVLSFTPPDQTTGVSLTPTLTMTFDEPIVASGAYNRYWTIAGNSNNHRVPVSYSASSDGKTLYVTPQEPLAPNEKYLVAGPQVPDLAYNFSEGYPTVHWSFTTGVGDTSDLVRPTVTQMSPASGSIGIPYANPVLTFSEPLNPSTVSPQNFAVFAGGNPLLIETIRSSDNQTVTLHAYGGNITPGDAVHVYVTSGVTDFAGNALVPFSAWFETLPTPTTGEAPRFLGIRPDNGATKVAPDNPITLFYSEPIDGSTIASSIQVSVDGVLVGYSHSLRAGGRVIEIDPDAAFPEGALVEVFGRPTLLGETGLQAHEYLMSWYFNVATAPMAEPTRLISTSPNGSAYAPAPANAEVMLRFNNPLQPTTVNSETLLSRQGGSNIAGTISFEQDNRVVVFRPSAPVTSANRVNLFVRPGVLDAAGEPVATTSYSLYFSLEPDSTPPAVERLTPPVDATEVPVNNPIEIKLDEWINTAVIREADFSVTSAGGVAMPFTLTESNHYVRLSPTVALQDNTTYTVSWTGARDLAGNTTGPISFSFTTSDEVDFSAPGVRSVFPEGQTISRTGNLVITFSEPMHPPSVNPETIYLEKSSDGTRPAVAVSLNDDGTIAVLQPEAPLEASTSYQLVLTNLLQDRGGLPMSSYTLPRTTNSLIDTTPPTVTLLPGNGATNVPLNASVFVLADKALVPDAVAAEDVRLLLNGQPVSASLTIAEDRLLVKLRPLQPLAANTTYTVTVQGLKDISGNTMAGEATSAFTTGAEADLIRPTLISSQPAPDATGVSLSPVIELRFSEPVTPPMGGFKLNQTPIDVQFGADGSTVAIRPTVPLTPDTSYRIDLSVRDLAGNPLASNTPLISFRTGP